MNHKRFISFFLLVAAVAGMVACNSGGDTKTTDASNANNAGSNAATNAPNPKGIGPHQNVQLTHPLDETMVTAGKNVYEVKCASCHKTTDEKLVGPGWKGVTDRRTPEWIMNFVTNVEEMIEKDPEAQKMLEECLVRMPNQNLSEADARATLEFMRKNDGKN
ncbi:MAG: cytochrome c [Flavisolibacter sp.]|jgi:mono/diheme cytochrome c family protein|nr:cytochrome c [Flavisolibacter sp.]